MSLRQYLINHLTSILPPTRGYSIKVKFYKWADLQIAATTRLVSSVSIWGKGQVRIGANSFIGHEVQLISGTASIHIGRDVDVGPRTLLVNGSHQIDMTHNRTAGNGQSSPIIIEDGVWIGACCTILGGVKIGYKSIIAAGSVVTKDVPPLSLVAGCPATVKKKWLKSKQAWINI